MKSILLSIRRLPAVGNTLVILCMLWGISLQAQTYNGNLFLSTQAQVDAFAYSEVTGFIYISNSSISNLNGLSSLTSLGGDLSILFNSSLTSLDGLEGLNSIPGRLWIRENDALTNLDGLTNVSSIGGFLGIDGNDVLTNVNGLNSLVTVGGEVAFDLNATLTNVDGLSSLTTIGRWLFFAGNPSLTDLDGLSSLTSIGAALDLRDNASLTQIDGLAGLTDIPGRLWVKGNGSLTNLDGLANVTSIGEAMIIDNNASLSDCCGLYNLYFNGTIGGYVNISNNLVNCSAASVIGNCAPPTPPTDWKEIGPLSSPISSIGYDGSLFLYAASNYGVFRSTDNGDTWSLQTISTPTWVEDSRNADQIGFATVGGTVYAVGFSFDAFNTEPAYMMTFGTQAPVLPYICAGPNEDPCLYNAFDLISIGNRLLISAGSSVWYRDVPSGDWTIVNVSSYELFRDGNQIISSGANGVVSVSTDQGQSWQGYSGGNLPGTASGFARKGIRLFASVPGLGVFVSKNGGSWVAVNSGLGSLNLSAIVNHQQTIYVGTTDSWVWKSTNNGQSWKKAWKGSFENGLPVTSLLSKDSDNLFAGTPNGISRKAPGSDTWSHTVKGLSSSTIDWIAARNDAIVAAKTIGAREQGDNQFQEFVYQSENPWKSWQAEELGSGTWITVAEQQDHLVMVVTSGGDYFYPELFSYYLNGSGPTYGMDFCYNGLQNCQYEEDIHSVVVIGDTLFYVGEYDYLGYRIGISPTRGMNDGTFSSFTYSYTLGHKANKLKVDGSILIACTEDGVYTSADKATSWSPAGMQGINVLDITEGNNFWLAQTANGLYRAWKSNPNSWQSLGVANPGPYIIWANKVLYSIIRSYSNNAFRNPFGGTSELRYSIDKGDSWQTLTTDPDMPLLNPFALGAEGNDYLFVGTEGRGIWRHPLLNPPAARLAAPEEPSMQAYPNPTPGFITIEAEGKGTLDIFTPDGRWMGKTTFEGPTQTVDLNNIPSGIYFIRLMNAVGVQTIQVSKQ